MKFKNVKRFGIIGIILLILVNVNFKTSTNNSNSVKKEITYLYMSRDMVIKKIDCSLFVEPEKVFNFYNMYTKNEKVTKLIIQHAKKNNVPYNLMFAQCYAESNFKITAINYSNSNGTRDYGLFQLNSNSFKKYSKSYLMNIENNIRIAAIVLKENYQRYNSWEESIIAYNAGNPHKAPASTINYLVKILEYENSLNRKFLNYISE